MKLEERISSQGHVYPSYVNIKTGEAVPWSSRHNTISYEASAAMAKAFGGDFTVVPNRIGIIYGNDASPQFSWTIGREQSWSDLKIELTNRNADVQVQPFCYSPSIKEVYRNSNSESSSQDSSSESGKGTAVIFHSHSDSVTPGEFGTCVEESSSSYGSAFIAGSYIYQAVLLNKSATGDYKILARVSLDVNHTYNKKPDGFEVALDWAVKFF